MRRAHWLWRNIKSFATRAMLTTASPDRLPPDRRGRSSPTCDVTDLKPIAPLGYVRGLGSYGRSVTHDHIYCRLLCHAPVKPLAPTSSHHRAPVRHPAAVRRFGKSDEFLRFDQTFDPTLGMIEPEWSHPMVIFFKRLIKDASGVTAIEYGLLCALIVIGSVTAIYSTGLALNLTGTFGRVASHL